MSLLPPEVHAALGQLLQSLQSADNVERSRAEEALRTDWEATRPEVLLAGLAEIIQGAGAPQQQQQSAAEQSVARTFAAVLFRRIATRTRKDPQTQMTGEIFLSLQPAQRVAIREKLLQSLSSEQVPNVRKKIGDAVAEVARQHTDENAQWPELLGVLFQLSQSEIPGQRETAFRVFATTPGIIEAQHQDVVLGAFTKGFQDSENQVKISAVDAFSAFFRSLNRKAQQKYYSLIPEVLNILPPLKEAQDDSMLTEAFVSLIELAEVTTKMFKPFFNHLVNFSIGVIQDKELNDTTRQNALELMATFAEHSPQMCKKDASYTTQMVTQCLSLMTDVGVDDDDAAEWNACEDLDADESDMNHIAAEQCMDRLANKLGGQALLPPTFNWLPRMVASTMWKDRHAALMAISAISEGCRDLMIGELDKVLELVIPALRDPHPRVRWAGCNALGQMSTDFAGTMQEKYHQLVIPNIIPVLDSPEPRVQAHAAAALVNFCEEAEKSVLEPYLDGLLSKLIQLLASPKRFVQEQALSTIATVADSAEASFAQYYPTLMPMLFNVLKNEQSKEYRLLRAKAMECATLIALAVGAQGMGNDAFELVNLLGAIQQGITDADDPQASYLLHCWGRMCRVMGRDFLPYLPAVIPPLTELASAKADIQFLDDDDKIAAFNDEDGWELVPLKGKVIGIRTSTLDDKHMAIELITIYAQVLEDAFEPYVNDIMDRISLPGLAFFFHDPVRVASAKSVPALLNAYKKAHGATSPQLGQLWERTVEKLLEVLTTEPSIDTLAEMYQCFYECVECVGANCLTNVHMAAFIDGARSVLEDYQDRVRGRLEEAQERREEGDEENEDALYAIEDDQTLLSDMNKAFHTVFKQMGTNFLPEWQRLMEFYTTFVNNADPTQRQWAICIFDDVLEFCGPQSWNYSQQIMTPLVNGMRDDVSANRQAAVYGVGVAAQKGGAAWADFVAESIPTLFAVTQRPTAREDDDVYATENACASIAKILHFNSAKVSQVQDVVQAWVDTLPIVNDEEAAPYAYGFLNQLIDQQNPAVMNQAAKCFAFIAQALEAETLQGNNASRSISAANRLVVTAGLDANQLLSSLPPETQNTVRTLFSG